VATLISVPLTIFLYFQSQQTSDLVFAVDPTRTIIARAGRPSELKVEFKGEAIKTDVVGTQVALWNQGKRSIHAGDVLTPLEIRLSPPTPILQVSVAKTSRSVIALALGNDADMLRQGWISVGFRILEKDDGGNIQIIYAGPSDVEVSLVGVVEGAAGPRNLRATGLASSPGKGPPSFGARLFWRLLPWAYVLWLIILPLPVMIKHVRRRGPRSTLDVIYFVTDCVMFAAAISMLLFVFHWFPYVPTPPFGY
jgi:hypothetical protein